MSPFKYSGYFYLVVLFLLLTMAESLLASERPVTLKAYFDSFAKGNKQNSKESWISLDKGYHIVGSMICTTLVGQLSKKGFDTSTQKTQVIGAGTSFTLGLVKEIYDSKKPQNKFSWKDLAANGVGIIIGVILLGID